MMKRTLKGFITKQVAVALLLSTCEARQAVDMMKRMFKGMLKEGDRVLPPRIHPGVYALLPQ